MFCLGLNLGAGLVFRPKGLTAPVSSGRDHCFQ